MLDLEKVEDDEVFWGDYDWDGDMTYSIADRQVSREEAEQHIKDVIGDSQRWLLTSKASQ